MAIKARKPAKKATAKRTAKKATKRSTAKRAPAKRSTTRKTTTRKTTARKTTTKRVAAKAAKPVVKKISTTPIKDKLTKTELYTTLAEATDLTKKQVAAVFDAFTNVISRCIGKRSGRRFDFPGLMKITVIRKPATKERKGINPFTGEEMMFKAKPARNIVKVRALKKLKEMAAE